MHEAPHTDFDSVEFDFQIGQSEQLLALEGFVDSASGVSPPESEVGLRSVPRWRIVFNRLKASKDVLFSS